MSDLHETDDSALLDDFRDSRSERAFTELVRRHLPLVFHVALRRLTSAALAEEAAQHVFSRLAAKVSAVARHPERLRAWLHRTAWFEASNLARKEARLTRLPVNPVPEPMNRPEIYDRLDEALNRLPELDRELVLRHCCGGEDYRRMAAAVGKSEAACQKRVERALGKLAQTVGGARTVGAVSAAFVATSTKLPAAERVAAAALKHHAAASGAAGAATGLKAAACAALALAGGAAGWQKDERPPVPPALVRSTSGAPAGESSTAKAGEIPLAPRPVRLDRSLDEVLESIQAGRLLPLVEFLPQATVSDLRAIIAEDDLSGLAERMGDFGSAHGLAVQRWAEVDPSGALTYGISRSTDISTAVLAKWLMTDRDNAATAYLALSMRNRRRILDSMVTKNDAVAGQLAALDPGLAWIVDEARLRIPDPAVVLENAERLVSGWLAENRQDEPTSAEAQQVVIAFAKIAAGDAERAIAQAKQLRSPGLRDYVLAILYHNHPPASAGLPPGPIRTEALRREAEILFASDPAAVIRRLRATPPGAERDAIFGVISEPLAGSDPWQLLELVASLDGYLAGGAVPRALAFARKDDPRRALALLPEIIARIGRRPTGFAEIILSDWLEEDPPAAIRWATSAGIVLSPEQLGASTGDPHDLLELLHDPNPEVKGVVQAYLGREVASELANGRTSDLLDKMPAATADDIIWQIATDACLANKYDAALRAAAMASPAGRGEKVLPRMGFIILRFDPVGGLEWLKSLPAADQRAVVIGLEKDLEKTNDPTSRKALELLKP